MMTCGQRFDSTEKLMDLIEWLRVNRMKFLIRGD